MKNKKINYLIITIIILSYMMPAVMAYGAGKTADITIKMLKVEYNNQINEVPGCIIDGKAYIKLADSCIFADFGYLAYQEKESRYIIVPSGFNWESASKKYGYVEIPRDKNKECGKSFSRVSVKELTIEFFGGDIKKADGFVIDGKVYVKLADFVKLDPRKTELKYDSKNKKYIVIYNEEATEAMPRTKSTAPDKMISATPTPNPSKYSDLTLEEQVIKMVNEERAKEGLPELKVSPVLTELAAVRAKEIRSNYSHTRPDGNYCFDALIEAGVRIGIGGENIAAAYKTPDDVMRAWMNSPGHKANILRDGIFYIGVGYYHGDDGYDYWVQLFIEG